MSAYSNVPKNLPGPSLAAPASVHTQSLLELPGPSIALLTELFLDDVTSASSRTRVSYRSALDRFELYLEEEHVTYLDKQAVKAYGDYLDQTDAHDEKKRRKLSAATRKLYVAVVKHFFTWCFNEGKTPTDLGTSLKPARVDNTFHKKLPLEKNDLLRIKAAIAMDMEYGKTELKRNKAYRDLVMFLLCTAGGLRVQELALLNIGDIQKRGKARGIMVFGKGHQEADMFVPIHSGIMDLLDQYIADLRPLAGPDDPIFVKRAGKDQTTGDLEVVQTRREHQDRLSAQTISKIFKARIVQVCGSNDKITPHSLRRTAANMMIDSEKMKLQDVQQFLRHKSIQTTMVYYNESQREKNIGSSVIVETIGKDLLDI